MNLEPTAYYWDAIEYYKKAKILEDRNHRGGKVRDCGDPLMDNCAIYDTILRRHAGFSNVPEDLLRRGAPDDFTPHRSVGKRPKHDILTWIFLLGVHRYTGSGASFYPKSAGRKRHGYCNTIMFEIAFQDSIKQMCQTIESYPYPMFTSKGNQIIPAPKPVGRFTSGAKYYLCTFWPQVAKDLYEWITTQRQKPTIREATAYACEWNVRHGMKRFVFTTTALVCDIAEYFPNLIDPRSQCNYGANCLLAFDAIFDPIPQHHRPAWYDAAMERLCSDFDTLAPKGIGARPMDLEDCIGCDSVRYWSEFVPKIGYDHLTLSQRKNSSRIKPSQFKMFIEQRG